MNIEDLLKYMLELFQKTEQNLKDEFEKLSQKDMELNDLYHYIEIHKLKAYEYAQVGKLIKTLREERRHIKNNIEMIQEIKQFTDKYNNRLIQGDIIKTLKGYKTIENKQDKPIYTYKTNILERLNNGKNRNTNEIT